MAKRPAALAARLVADHPEASTFLVVGAAFKPGEVVTTNAPGEALARKLIAMGKYVAIHDPLVRDAGHTGGLRFITESEWNVDSIDITFDVVVSATWRVPSWHRAAAAAHGPGTCSAAAACGVADLG